jgi:hypothetical protein
MGFKGLVYKKFLQPQNFIIPKPHNPQTPLSLTNGKTRKNIKEFRLDFGSPFHGMRTGGMVEHLCSYL